jgi:predicted nucleic acid-binding protein
VATGYLLDTNILLRLTSRDSALHAHIQRAVRQILQQDVSLFCCPQNVVELWNVLTRPIDRNGFGLSITEAEEEIQLIEREFGFLPDNQQIHAVWRRLVYDHRVRGRASSRCAPRRCDARLWTLTPTHLESSRFRSVWWHHSY